MRRDWTCRSLRRSKSAQKQEEATMSALTMCSSRRAIGSNRPIVVASRRRLSSSVRCIELTPSFEDRVTLGLAQWITLIETNGATGTLRIGLTHQPQNPETERCITFTGVTNVQSEWFGRDDECMESLLGIHEDHDENQLRYMFHTEQRELWIWATKSATITEVGV